MRRPDRTSAGWHDLITFSRFGGAGVVAAVVGGVVAHQTGTATPAWLVGTLCLAGGLLLGGGAVVASGYRTPPRPLPPSSIRARTDRESGGLQRVERTLDRGFSEVERFNLRVRPWLIALAEQRLRHHPVIDMRELLGEPLWQLTEQPLTTVPTKRQMAEWIARIEAL